jgi:Uncharacterized protein conserved in bacteria
MNERLLIVNADDFGFSEESNKAILELFLSKRITSTSLLATAEAAGEAIEIGKKYNLPVGTHLTINSDFDEAPWRCASGADSLDFGGYLTADQKKAARATSEDVTAECEAQIKIMTDAGLPPDHLDNHCGTLYGINGRLFFINAFKIAKKHDLRFRFPRRATFLDAYFGGRAPLYVKALLKGVVLTSKAIGAKIIDDMNSSPAPIKDIENYKALEDYYLNLITRLKPGINEIFLHPAYHSEKYSALTPEWKKREYEREFLTGEKYLKRIRDEGIKLISYREL